MDKYLVTDFIGSGEFGVVKKAINKEDQKTYSIKVLNLNNKKEILSANKEIKILEYINDMIDCNIHILCYNEFIEENKKIYIITEFLTNYFTLTHFMENKLSHYYDMEDYNKIFENMCCGLKVLHSISVVHRDIKPDNILLNVLNLNVKYIDFGLADIKDFGKIPKLVGTPGYIDVRLTNYYKDIDFDILKNADLWSLGMVIYYLIFGEIPYKKFKKEYLQNNQNAEIIDILYAYANAFNYEEMIGDIPYINNMNTERKKNGFNPIDLYALIEVKDIDINKYYCKCVL